MPDASRLRELWSGLGGRGQFSLVVSGLAVIITGFFLFKFAAKPSYTTLVSNLSANDAAQTTKALESSGITYRLQDGGTTISVLSSKAAAARLAIAQQGLPSGGHVGFELFDKKSLGITDFQQKVDYQRALEGEIARTIEQIQGVDSADVQLVLPDDSLFADQSSKASAAVLINGSLVDAATVRGIAHLVASSVKGLDASGVTITNSQGELLWPSAGSGTLGAASKLQAEQNYDNQLTSQINAMLTSTLGENKAQARVHAELSLDQREVDSVVYGKRVPVTSKTDTETLKNNGQTQAGAAGVTANVPPAATTTTTTTTAPTTTTTAPTTTTTTPAATTASAPSTSPNSNYRHQTTQTDYNVDKTIEHTTTVPGSVTSLQVALMVDSSVPAAQLAGLKSAVASMAGIDTKRGDALTVSRVAFAKPVTAAVKASPLSKLPLGLAKKVLLGLAGLIFLFLLTRALKKREGAEVAAEPTWLREIEADWPIRELDAPTMRLELEPSTGKHRDQMREEFEEIARAQPDKVALQVAQWVED